MALAVAVPSGAFATGATATQWYWSESYAEQTVLGKVRLPCKAIFPTLTDRGWPAQDGHACDVKATAAELAAAKKYLDARIAKCKQEGNPYLMQRCAQGLLSFAEAETQDERDLSYARN